ncbi:hypothetical protein [Agriterribacter sp.]|mgnify:CR=1 FL=1|uniref:hypothetical protein n=1 Tax=Agriterribacter sp. TaxID=2821509 RepID=UPI002D17C126|nr:hypothetical protein [Agriterribacter sp.]HRO47303.1 hypothetical protein [Agriterribacter sp.]HRQ18188.1 hypothetical protein [Agriterribacter sp.]
MKTYQLLRNNKQMGYYTKTCLLQIGLQPLDLLWVEGESITWKHPSELEEFCAYASPVELTEATVVNNRKEKQILYFDSHMAEMEYKKVNIQYIQEPDAVLYDVAPGYEYLVRAQSFRLPVDEVIAENNAGQEAVDAAQAILDHAYPVMGAGQIIDTPEYKADYNNFTTIWKVKNRKEEQVEDSAMRKKPSLLKSGLGAIITGLITLAATGFNFKI